MNAPVLTPTDAASVRWAVTDMETDAAARRLADLLGLDRDTEDLLTHLLWECWAQGYCEGYESCRLGGRNEVIEQ